MLHIITPLYRFELLEKIYRTIPKKDDIVWHISKSVYREKLNHDFIFTDKRVKLYEIDCLDSDIITKRNTVFKSIKEGFFYLLDDDTIFLEEVYSLYKEQESKGFIGMIIGNQWHYAYSDNKRRAIFPTLNPETTDLDTGMVICYHSVLKEVQWDWSNLYKRDCYFWSRCFKYFGKEKTLLVNRTISIYNYYGALIYVNKKVLFFNINFKITNPRIAKVYLNIVQIKRKLKTLL